MPYSSSLSGKEVVRRTCGGQQTVLDVQNAVGQVRVGWVVRDHEDRLTVAIQLKKNSHDLFAGLAVESARRRICE